jgi:hypothetical protein
MPVFTVQRGKRYVATLSLGLLERFASNEMVEGKLREYGFVDVKVTGSGGVRQATATWPNDDATAELPSQITSVQEA